MTENSSQSQFTRRQFGRSFGAALAAAVVSPNLIHQIAGGHSDAHMPSDAVFINFNENPYGPSPRAIEAITGSEAVAGRYPDGVYSRLVQAIAEFHHVSAENVALGCGSTEILRACDDAFLSSGKNLVIAEPTFEAVTHYAEACKASAVKIPLTSDFRHDLPKMAAACTDATGLVYICNPNNPTATIMTRDELADFMNRVPASTHVLVDEAYFHFVEDPRYTSLIDWTAKYPNLVVARTFSKVYGMAGMRLGYAIAQKETTAALRSELTQQNGNAAVLPAAIASLADPEVVPVNKKRLNDTRKWVTSELAKDGHRVMPSEANFFMVDVGGDVSPVIEAFRQRKIMVGRKFHSLGNWLRVSVGKPEEMQKFLAAFREVVPAKKSAQAA
ncbi:MAG TPA: histidinol-phosphate transaminase [Candidatus Acidoferrales bacterium]|nr:histidinol-phosphate transaminase [Candidatus Acidoferrales bacterium]